MPEKDSPNKSYVLSFFTESTKDLIKKRSVDAGFIIVFVSIAYFGGRFLYNAYIDKNADMKPIKDEIKELTKEIKGQRKQIDGYKAEIANLNTTIENQTVNINNIRSDYEDFKRKHPPIEVKVSGDPGVNVSLVNANYNFGTDKPANFSFDTKRYDFGTVQFPLILKNAEEWRLNGPILTTKVQKLEFLDAENKKLTDDYHRVNDLNGKMVFTYDSMVTNKDKVIADTNILYKDADTKYKKWKYGTLTVGAAFTGLALYKAIK